MSAPTQPIPKLHRPSVYLYHDYRKFLKDQLAWLDQVYGHFSIRAASLKAGMGESHLPQVVRGVRNLTSSAQKKLFPILKLNLQEQSFLQLLCRLADSHNDADKLKAISKMQKFSTFNKDQQSSTENYKYMSHWYNVAIREMTYLENFKLDPKWIQSRLQFKVSLMEIKKSIGFLVNNGFIRIDLQGKVVPENRHIDASGGIFKVALGEFHRQMFGMAIESIKEVHRDERVIDSNTFPVSEEEIPVIKEMLNQAIDGVVKYINQSSIKNKSQIYHISFAGFPVTKKKSRELKSE